MCEPRSAPADLGPEEGQQKGSHARQPQHGPPADIVGAGLVDNQAEDGGDPEGAHAAYRAGKAHGGSREGRASHLGHQNDPHAGASQASDPNHKDHHQDDCQGGVRRKPRPSMP